MKRIRFHGRGGEGVKLASRIASRAAFLAGGWVQDSPLYGAERRGAPVVAFVRIDDHRVRERGYIDAPDAVVVLDPSLLDDPEAAVLDGVDETTLLLMDTPASADALRERLGRVAAVVTRDVSAVARAHLGGAPISAPIAAFAARAAGLAGWEDVRAAARAELAAIGLSPATIERNVAAARAVYEATPEIGLAVRRTAAPAAGGRGASASAPASGRAWFAVPRMPAATSLPVIDAGATSELRRTDGWRTERPVIDLARCSRCALCFVYCPEGAVRLDADGWPSIDDAHCKGCLVCVRECPPGAIAAVCEEAA